MDPSLIFETALTLAEQAKNSPWGRFGGLFLTALASIAPVVATISRLRESRQNRRARELALRMEEDSRVGAFTEEEIRHALKDYTSPNCASIDPANEADLRNVLVTAPLMETIEDYLGKENRRHLIVLADSGMGKTTFCLNFYARQMKRRGAHPVAVIALGRPGALQRIKEIRNKRSTTLLLDALDEDAEAIDRPHERFATIMSAAADFRAIIITCRSQFFPNDEAVPKGSGVMYAGPRKAGANREYELHCLYIAPFNANQIRLYLRKHFPLFSIRGYTRRKRAREMIDQIHDLAVRPMLMATLPDLVRQGKRITETYSLYEFMVESWLQRERSWIDVPMLHTISVALAVTLYCKQSGGGDDRMPPDEFESLCHASGWDVPRWQLTQRSLLNRDSEGNLKFAHRSILEYLFVFAAIAGEDRCFTVAWTREMRRLFLSWGRTDAATVHATYSLMSRDLRNTRLLPLYEGHQERAPSLTLAEIKTILSMAPSQRPGMMPEHWHVACLSTVTTPDTITVIDVAYDTTWTGVNILAVDDPAIYRDPDTAIRAELFEQNTENDGVTAGVLPTLDEVSSLIDAAMLQRPNVLFIEGELYWLGQTLGESLLAFSIAPTAAEFPNASLLHSRPVRQGTALHVFEIPVLPPSRAAFAGRDVGGSKPVLTYGLSLRLKHGTAQADRHMYCDKGPEVDLSIAFQKVIYP